MPGTFAMTLTPEPIVFTAGPPARPARVAGTDYLIAALLGDQAHRHTTGCRWDHLRAQWRCPAAAA
jgi:rubredoxin